MSIADSIILGIVQGLTEFLPISSSGHLILFREVLGINIAGGLAFDSVLQLATTLAVVVYFYRDLLQILKTFLAMVACRIKKKALPENFAKDRGLVIAIIIGTIPAVVFGLLLESYMDTVFRNPLLVAATLLAGALVMIFAENYYRQNNAETSENISTKKALAIGCFQSLALIPGMSRSGMTIAGGLFSKISRDVAVRFSFLLAVPVLLGSGLKKLFDLLSAEENLTVGADLFFGSAASFVVGLLAIHFLIKFLKNHSLKVFAWYRILLAGVIVLILI